VFRHSSSNIPSIKVVKTGEEGKDVLATVHGISRALIDELFHEIDKAAPTLLEEYGVEDEVDIEHRTELVATAARDAESSYRGVKASVQIADHSYQVQLPPALDAGL